MPKYLLILSEKDIIIRLIAEAFGMDQCDGKEVTIIIFVTK